MFGSQALETAIGLVAMFFVLATAASSMTEVVARLTKKRAKDLERGLAALFKGQPVQDKDLDTVLGWFKDTSIWGAAESASGLGIFVTTKARRVSDEIKRGKKGPSYLSAKMFADAVMEMLGPHKLPTLAELKRAKAAKASPAAHPGVDATLADWPENLRKRLEQLKKEERTDLLSAKSALEGWFDEAMGRVEGAYKRWAQTFLFAFGLFLAVALNLSTVSVATQLWQDPVTRDAVVAASEKLLEDGATAEELDTVAKATEKINEVNIPGGWSQERREVWTNGDVASLTQLSDVAGWLLTGLLVMLGGPFWFDLLNRLVSLRGAGPKPDPAGQDPASATSVAVTAAAKPTPLLVDASSGGAQTQLEDTNKFTPAGPASETFTKGVGLT
jgi:hypothetical protein